MKMGKAIRRRRFDRKWFLITGLVAMLQGWQPHALAQTSAGSAAVCNPATAASAAVAQPCLATLVQSDISTGTYAYNSLELAAAQADDTAYENLLKICGPSGSGCSGAQLGLFKGLRALEDNAAELLGFGQTQFGFNLSAQGLGFALRWTADEEYSSQTSLTNRIANSQLETVGNRLSAVRLLSQTMRMAQRDSSGDDGADDDSQLLAATDRLTSVLGGAAGADSNLPGVGQWSVFANAGYGSGSKAPTVFNDAFKFDGTQFELGADIRLSRQTVLGFLASETEQHADFNSSQSVTAGDVRGTGGSLTAYFESDWEAAFINLSLGVQRMGLDTRRVVTYPSNNPEVASVNTNFLSSTNATTLLGTGGGGYTFYLRAFSATPYLSAQYLGTRVGSFAEVGHGSDPALALTVAGQSLTSLEGIAGLKLQYALAPRFGVLIPYAYGEFRREFRDRTQTISSQYTSSPSVTDQFQLPTDNVKPDYYEAGAGFISVLPHRTQVYLQYMKVLQLQYYTYYMVSGGFRFQF